MNNTKNHSDMMLLLFILSHNYAIRDVRRTRYNEIEGKLIDNPSSEDLSLTIDSVLTDLRGGIGQTGAGLSFTQTIHEGDIQTAFCIFHADN